MRILISCCIALLFAFQPAADEAADATGAQVEAVVLDYVMSYYEGDGERMKGALHPHLAKRRLVHQPHNARPELDEMSAIELVDVVATGWGTRVAEDRRLAEVTILDIAGDRASAKLVATNFEDYLHLQRIGDEWKIVNVLWSFRQPEVSSAIRAALEHPDRGEGDRALDAMRLPGEILAFAGIEEGMAVADLMAGQGWYSEVLARTVGAEGHVYLQNNAFVVERFADEGIKARLADDRLPNVSRWDAELEELGFEPESLDAAMMVLFYHDTFWQEVDRAKMNAGILAALKPGGVFLVIDHYAESGSGERDVDTLHRGDREQIRNEILAAGFLFVGSSPVLRHPEDDRSVNVFDQSIRRKTDRFVDRYVKPGRR